MYVSAAHLYNFISMVSKLWHHHPTVKWKCNSDIRLQTLPARFDWQSAYSWSTSCLSCGDSGVDERCPNIASAGFFCDASIAFRYSSARWYCPMAILYSDFLYLSLPWFCTKYNTQFDVQLRTDKQHTLPQVIYTEEDANVQYHAHMHFLTPSNS